MRIFGESEDADGVLHELGPMAGTLIAVADDGKIPQHDRWQERIIRGDLAIDNLMTLAGFASFVASQAELDDRIRNQLR